MGNEQRGWRGSWLFELSRLCGMLCVVFVACEPAASRAPSAPTAQPAPPRPIPDPHALARRDLAQAFEAARRRLQADERFRRQRRVTLGFEDDGVCLAAPTTTEADVDVDRALWVHDRATLDAADFTLAFTLGQLASQAVAAGAAGTTAAGLFTQLWDTQNPPGIGSGAHCTDDSGQVNGYPINCRAEGTQASDPATNLARYWPIGLVNRMDLAQEGWRNCGEFRVVYGRNDVTSTSGNGFGRAFVIFEGVLPNPRPGCRSACQPVADFWQGLSDATLTPAQRAASLHQFFYDGLPGFEPVVHINHYTAQGSGSAYGSSGGGQIRTNGFFQAPWLLKEYRLALDCEFGSCELAILPTMVKVNPFGPLFNEGVAETPSSQPAFQSRAGEFQAEFVTNAGALAGKMAGTCPGSAGVDINRMSYPVSLVFDQGQSEVDLGFDGPPATSNNAFDFQFIGPDVPGLFRELLAASPDTCGLTNEQLVKRAQALSCAGCHNPDSFGLTNSAAIGPLTGPGGASLNGWPQSLGFVHALEIPTSGVHPLSPALTNVFLPDRRRFLVHDALDQPHCGCRETFVTLPAPLRETAVKLEDEVTSRLAPKIEAENTRLQQLTARGAPKGEQNKAIAAARRRATQIEAEREKAVGVALRAAKIVVPPLDTPAKTVVLNLGVRQLAEGEPTRKRELMMRALTEIQAEEPPRRTVTGSFNVH